MNAWMKIYKNWWYFIQGAFAAIVVLLLLTVGVIIGHLLGSLIGQVPTMVACLFLFICGFGIINVYLHD